MALPALNAWYVRPELLDSVGLATMSQSSCLTTPRAKSMHSRCIAPASARTRMRTSRWWATFPTWPKSANIPSISGLTSGLTSGCGLTLLDCALFRVLPYSSRSNKLFMSVSFMGAPAEGSFSARNFRPDLPPMNSSAVPTMVISAASLNGECLHALRRIGGLRLQKRCVEVHQAVVARNERQVTLFLQHRGVHEL